MFYVRDASGVLVICVVQPKPVRDLTVTYRGVHPPIVSFGAPKSRKTIRYRVSVNCSSYYTVKNFFTSFFAALCLDGTYC